MRAKRVVLLSNRSLMATGVQRLLQGVDSLELSIVAAEDSEAIPKLRRLAPQVIVLDSGDNSLGEGVITRMLAEHPTARVIALNLNRTGIDLFLRPSWSRLARGTSFGSRHPKSSTRLP